MDPAGRAVPRAPPPSPRGSPPDARDLDTRGPGPALRGGPGPGAPPRPGRCRGRPRGRCIRFPPITASTSRSSRPSRPSWCCFAWLVLQPILVDMRVASAIPDSAYDGGGELSLVMSDVRRVADGLDAAVAQGAMSADDVAGLTAWGPTSARAWPSWASRWGATSAPRSWRPRGRTGPCPRWDPWPWPWWSSRWPGWASPTRCRRRPRRSARATPWSGPSWAC